MQVDLEINLYQTMRNTVFMNVTNKIARARPEINR